MELWIPVTIAGAFLQNLRNVLQKSLKSRLSTWGATASRFVYAAPLAVLLFAVLSGVTGEGVGVPPGAFFAYGMAGGLAQFLRRACSSVFSPTRILRSRPLSPRPNPCRRLCSVSSFWVTA